MEENLERLLSYKRVDLTELPHTERSLRLERLELTRIRICRARIYSTPSEINAEVLVKPLVMRLKEIFQLLPNNRAHFWVRVLGLREHRGLGLPMR